jgi:RND family efflux transporter MFP subunit
MGDPLSEDLQALRIDRDAPSPSHSSGAVGRALVGVAVLGALGAAGAWALPHAQARIFKTSVRTAEVASVSPTQATTSVSATGYVVALTVSRVQPRVPGRVARVTVREGDTVRAGQVLLELDALESRGAIAASNARALAAQARVAVARANLAESAVQLERQRRLVASGSAPRSAVEDLEARMIPLRASIEAAAAEARAAQAEVASLRINLGQLTVTAPFDGMVLNRPPVLGDLVGAGALAGSATAATAAVIEVMDPRSLVVEVDVPEARLGLVRVGGPCEIALDAFPDRRLACTVAELGHRVDRAKATVPVRVRFAAPMAGALPEMSARVSFLTAAPAADALQARARTVLPAAALTARAGRQSVFTVEDGVARLQPVRVGERAGDGYELIEGPPPGARVVLSPPAALADGSPVKETAQ